MNDIRIGNLGIAMVVLAFLIVALSGLFLSFENTLGLSGIGDDLNEINTASGLNNATNNMIVDLSTQVDDASDLAASSDQQVEDRSSSTSGVLNLYSKNIFYRFIDEVSKTFGIPSVIINFLLGIVGVVVTILVTRFFFGRDRS